jgi:glyoxylase-like metal-dependent hydrolase (beta-lactamase superfamily II)
MTISTGRVLRLVLGTNNVYVLSAPDGVTLIDAGPDYDGAWEELLAQLDANGIAPDTVRTVLLTHAHLDHAGLAARWQSLGARILIGRADAPALAMDVAARDHERALARRELIRNGLPADALSTRPSGVEDPGRPAFGSERYTRWPSALRMTTLHPDCLLDDGDVPGSDAGSLRVVAAPGHTPGTLLVLDEATGALFTGDHLLPRMAPTSGIQFERGRRRPSLPAYLHSLRATLRLADRVTTVYPGHGEPFDDLAEAVEWTVRLLEQRARRTLHRLHDGPATAYEVALRMFPHLGPRHLRPVMAETIGLLDLLAERGLAAARDADPICWETAGPADRPHNHDASHRSTR